MIPTDPMQKVAMPRLDKTILPAFAAEDVKRLLAACSNDCDRALVLCLLATGCRAAEFVNLTIRDVEKKRHGMGFVRPQSVSVPHQGFLARRQGNHKHPRTQLPGKARAFADPVSRLAAPVPSPSPSEHRPR